MGYQSAQAECRTRRANALTKTARDEARAGPSKEGEPLCRVAQQLALGGAGDCAQANAKEDGICPKHGRRAALWAQIEAQVRDQNPSEHSLHRLRGLQA